MKRDLGLFVKIFETFDESKYRFVSKQVKGFSIIWRSDIEDEKDRHILVDEIDATFFKSA